VWHINKTLFKKSKLFFLFFCVTFLGNLVVLNLKMWKATKLVSRASSLAVRSGNGTQFRSFANGTDAEQRIAQILQKALNTTEVKVVDTSSKIFLNHHLMF
jgi:hypothetical protein